MRRRSIVAGLGALTFLAAWAPRASAMEEWCEDDPPIKVVTPDGDHAVLHLTTYGLGLQHDRALKLAQVSTAVRPAKDGDAKVTVRVTVPNDQFARFFPTRAVISTQPKARGETLAEVSGTSGRPMVLSFTFDS